MILDVITSSPLNVVVTLVIGIGLAYLYYRKPSSSSSSSSSRSTSNYPSNRATSHQSITRATVGGAIDEELQRAIAAIERQERDTIRQEQDAAYQQSLRADREKKLKREEELRDKEQREVAEKQRAAQLKDFHERLENLKCNITSKLPPEPSSEESIKLVKLVFKLPDGTRVKRNFRKEDKIKYMYWFVFSQNNAPLQFRMTTNFPKRDLPGRPPRPEDFLEDVPKSPLVTDEQNSEETLEDAGLTETQIIFVYDLEA